MVGAECKGGGYMLQSEFMAKYAATGLDLVGSASLRVSCFDSCVCCPICGADLACGSRGFCFSSRVCWAMSGADVACGDARRVWQHSERREACTGG